MAKKFIIHIPPLSLQEEFAPCAALRGRFAAGVWWRGRVHAAGVVLTTIGSVEVWRGFLSRCCERVLVLERRQA